MSDPDRKIIRSGRLAQNIIIIDGFPGCGKTLFGPIISSLDRVELLSYAFEIEFICRLNKLSKIEDDAAISLIKMLVDHKLYQTMMGRDTNFRYSDLSSVFNDSSPLRYFKRIFQKGDDFVPERIKEENPILSLTTHDLLAYSDPLVKGLEERLTFIEILRHPLYMIIQETSLIIDNFILKLTFFLVLIFALIGMLIERYLFFIQAKHVVGLYYGENKV